MTRWKDREVEERRKDMEAKLVEAKPVETSPLSEVPEGDLRKELARREIVRKQAEEEKRARLARLVEENVDALLTLVPEHSRTSCSDDHAGNSERGCARCVLLDVKRYGVLDFRFNLEVSFSVTRSEP